MGIITLYPAEQAEYNVGEDKWHEFPVESTATKDKWTSPYATKIGNDATSIHARDISSEIAYKFDVTQLIGQNVTNVRLNFSFTAPTNPGTNITQYYQCKYRETDPTNYSIDSWDGPNYTSYGYPSSSFSFDVSINETISTSPIYFTLTFAQGGQNVPYSLGSILLVSAAFTYDESGPGPSYDPPVVSLPSYAPINPSSIDSALESIWIAGVTNAKVIVAVEADTGLSIQSVSYTYSGHAEPVTMTLQDGFYVGTTPTAVTQQGMLFNITAIDSAGNTTLKENVPLSVTPQPYTDPSFSVCEVQRCDASGTADDAGEYYKIRIRTNVSELLDENGTDRNGIASGYPLCGVLNASGGLAHQHTLSDVTTWQERWTAGNPELGDPDGIYTIVVRIKDKVGHEGEKRVSINGQLLDIVMYRDTQYNKTHLGVGMKPDTSKGNGNTTVQLPVGAKIIVGGVDITAKLRELISGDW